MDSWKWVPFYFHAAGDGILLPNRYLDNLATFICIHYSLITWTTFHFCYFCPFRPSNLYLTTWTQWTPSYTLLESMLKKKPWPITPIQCMVKKKPWHLSAPVEPQLDTGRRIFRATGARTWFARSGKKITLHRGVRKYQQISLCRP